MCRETASSEAEMSHPLEGRSATLERGGGVLRGRGSRGEPSSEAEFVQRALEGPSSEAEIIFAGSRGMRMGRMLGFFESFPFLQIGKGPWAFVGLVALTGVCVLKRS